MPKRKKTKPTIYDIKYATQEKQPHFFTRQTLKFFRQTLRSFYVGKTANGKIFISWNRVGGGVGAREFTGDNLAIISDFSAWLESNGGVK